MSAPYGQLPVLRDGSGSGALAPLLQDALGGPGLSLAQVRAVLWAHRRISALIFAAIVVAAGLTIRLLPKTFTATATLVLNYEINDPLAGREFPLGLLASYTTTQMEIIRSPKVLLPVIEKLGLDKDPELISGWDEDRSPLRDWVREGLDQRLEVQPGVGGQLIYVTASSKTARQAADIANAVAATYLEQQVQRANLPAAEESERYAAQIEELRKNLTSAEQRLAAFERKTGIVAVRGDADVDADMLANLEQQLQEARSGRIAAEVRRAGDPAVSGAVIGSPLIQGMKSRLAEQEAELAQLSTTLGPAHPRIVELRSQIAATRATIRAEVGTLSSGNSADVEAARGLESGLEAAVAEQRAKVLAGRMNRGEGTKLLLELESAQSVYKRALDGYEQVKAAAGGRYSNVSLLSDAAVPLKSTRPNKPKLFLAAVALGAGLALLAPFLFEMLLDRRVRCVDDLERDLGVLVLAELDPAPGARSAS